MGRAGRVLYDLYAPGRTAGAEGLGVAIDSTLTLNGEFP